jgi:FkbM family methyltransferase
MNNKINIVNLLINNIVATNNTINNIVNNTVVPDTVANTEVVFTEVIDVQDVPDTVANTEVVFTEVVVPDTVANTEVVFTEVVFTDVPDTVANTEVVFTEVVFTEVQVNPTQKLNELHKKLKLKYGDFREEYPEQEMSVSYIKSDNVVLELGGNIGRNSCIIASLLNNSNNLVVFESDPGNAVKLKENCDLNNLNFIIEDSAISKTELLQNGWITKSKDLIKDNELVNWKPIKTMSWLQIKNKYKITFDTLVADCEGALYYILKDEPNFLENFKTIIIENDFNEIEHKHFVDGEFKRFNFDNVYTLSGGFGPCYNCFFEVWTKKLIL